MPLTLTVVAAFLLAGEKEQPEPDSPPTPVIDDDNDGFPADVDCDDADSAINPDAEELCDGIDNNCNDEIDEGVLSEWFADADGDSYGDPESSVLECEAPADHVADSSDCDDSDPAVNPDGEKSVMSSIMTAMARPMRIPIPGTNMVPRRRFRRTRHCR